MTLERYQNSEVMVHVYELANGQIGVAVFDKDTNDTVGILAFQREDVAKARAYAVKCALPVAQDMGHDPR